MYLNIARELTRVEAARAELVRQSAALEGQAAPDDDAETRTVRRRRLGELADQVVRLDRRTAKLQTRAAAGATVVLASCV